MKPTAAVREPCGRWCLGEDARPVDIADLGNTIRRRPAAASSEHHRTGKTPGSLLITCCNRLQRSAWVHEASPTPIIERVESEQLAAARHHRDPQLGHVHFEENPDTPFTRSPRRSHDRRFGLKSRIPTLATSPCACSANGHHVGLSSARSDTQGTGTAARVARRQILLTSRDYIRLLRIPSAIFRRCAGERLSSKPRAARATLPSLPPRRITRCRARRIEAPLSATCCCTTWAMGSLRPTGSSTRRGRHEWRPSPCSSCAFCAPSNLAAPRSWNNSIRAAQGPDSEAADSVQRFRDLTTMTESLVATCPRCDRRSILAVRTLT